MNKKCIVSLVLLVLFSFSCISCKKVNKVPVADNTTYEIGKKVTLPSSSDIVIQDVLFANEFKLQTTLEGVQDFPYIYLKKDKAGPRIIRIDKEGGTIDTLVDTVSSKSYSSAYIVESGGDLAKTIARYVLDTKKDSLLPKNSTDQFVFISILFSNKTKKPVLTKDFTIFIELKDKSQVQFDSILAETILSNTIPKEIKQSETVSLRYVAVLDKNIKEILVSFEGKKFKWENKDIKPSK